MIHVYNPNTQETGTGGLGVQGHPQLRTEFEASLGYVILCLKTKQKGKRRSQTASSKPPNPKEKQRKTIDTDLSREMLVATGLFTGISGTTRGFSLLKFSALC